MIFQGRFADKVMVVTGAAQGIGAGVAIRAAAEGASLVLVDRADFVTEVEQAIVAAGGKAVSVICDLETYEGA
ncbi:MAG: SDR family NAD(P)-dependent oxidoreductase, partial [Sphingomonadaceae bacterium]|nr:SDR family NAD(P)-dependent oxidoreductase [Sphingomonadaceae bacterium]